MVYASQCGGLALNSGVYCSSAILMARGSNVTIDDARVAVDNRIELNHAEMQALLVPADQSAKAVKTAFNIYMYIYIYIHISIYIHRCSKIVPPLRDLCWRPQKPPPKHE